MKRFFFIIVWLMSFLPTMAREEQRPVFDTLDKWLSAIPMEAMGLSVLVSGDSDGTWFALLRRDRDGRLAVCSHNKVDRPSDAFSYDIQNSELESVLSKKPRMEAIERHYQIKQDKGETTYVVVFGLLQETDPTKGQPCFFTLLTDRGSKVSFRIPEREN